jgi:hypothetical protein
MKKENIPPPPPPHPKSEEVQAIIDRMPVYWTKWFALIVFSLIVVLGILSFIIKYPDSVSGQISITAQKAPVRLVANSSGRVVLLKDNKSMIAKNEIIAYIQNGAKYKDILKLDAAIKKYQINNAESFNLNETLILGEVGAVFNNFFLNHSQYLRIKSSPIYSNMKISLKKKINSDKALLENLKKELILQSEILGNTKISLHKDSLLLDMKGISEQEYNTNLNSYLRLKESRLSKESNLLQRKSELNRNSLELDKIELEESEAIESALNKLNASYNELLNKINSWKEHYLYFSPIAGKLEYLGFWRNNSFLKSGEEIFSIIPDKNAVVGEVIVPSFGIGKVEIGQHANIKLNNYPYDEYGLIKGEVESISQLSNKLETPNGIIDAYLVTIAFPNGTTTNFGKTLKLNFETKGQIEIITKAKRLVQRLFDNLKSRAAK